MEVTARPRPPEPPVAQKLDEPPAPPPAPRAPALPAELWRGGVEAVRTSSPRHGKSLAFGRLVRISQGEVVVAFPPDADFHRSTVSGAGKPVIEQILSESFGAPTRLVIENASAAAAPPSIAEEEAKQRAAHERSVEARVRNHPALQSALRVLGGELEHVQVHERDRPPASEPEPPEDPN